MKTLRRGLLVAGVGAPLVLVGWAATRAPGPGTPPRPARPARQAMAPAVKATGVIEPQVGAEVKVGSRVSGVVARLHVQVGDRVRRGQLLAQLETRELVARRDQARAALAAAEAARAYARSDLRRRRALAAEGLLPAAELELAERAAAVAEQQASEAAANLDFALTQLDQARITAPIAGVVSSVATQEGETVAASLAAPTFVTLVDLARLEVRAYVDETDIGRVETGQVARFTVDTYPGHEFEGRIRAIYPQAEIRDNVVNYVAVVRFEPPSQHTLRPEMTASVRILLAAPAGREESR